MTRSLSAREEIKEVTRRIVASVRPSRVVLFGSHARRKTHKHSDLDILIVAESNLPRHRRVVPIYRLLKDLPTSVDILFYTPDEVRDWQGVKQSIVATALREGVTLYENAS